MSATAENVRNMTTNKAEIGIAAIRGRIDNVRRAKQKGFFTRMVLPAASEYDQPAYVEVFSNERLGNVGDDWQGKVKIGGSRRRYEVADKQTGEITVVQTAENYLAVIE